MSKRTRIEKLEQQARPTGRMVVLYEDDPTPPDTRPDDIIFRVVYGSDDKTRSQIVTTENEV